MKLSNKIFFYLYLILGGLVLILNTLRNFFNIDVIRDHPFLAKHLYVLQNMPISLKVVLTIAYFVILVFLYKKFSNHLDSISK